MLPRLSLASWQALSQTSQACRQLVHSESATGILQTFVQVRLRLSCCVTGRLEY